MILREIKSNRTGTEDTVKRPGMDFVPGFDSAGLLPNPSDLDSILELRNGGSVSDLLQPTLLEPVRYLTERSGKRIRGRLVTLAYKLAHPSKVHSTMDRQRCRLGAQLLEMVHAGSLVVDDIEDGSEERRGQPTLNRKYGLPIALNAGNWLYFWPLHVLTQMGLSPQKELLIFRLYQRTLLRAHFGQALDLGVLIDSVEQKRIPDVCLASMELKTGALVAFSLLVGGILGDASENALTALDEFGHGFGISLQMYDDLGNVSGKKEPSKRFEDLASRRPGWVWACAAQNSSEEEFRKFAGAVGNLPDEKQVSNWLEDHALIEKGKRQTKEYLATPKQTSSRSNRIFLLTL